MLQCSTFKVTVALTLRLLLLQEYSQWSTERSGVEKAIVLLCHVDFFFSPWIQHSKIKPGAGNGNCTAFYDVLQVPLRSFLVPRVASPHDYAAFSKVLWKEIPAAEKQKIYDVTVLPMIPCLPEISTESFGWYHVLSLYSFLGFHFPNCQINTQTSIDGVIKINRIIILIFPSLFCQGLHWIISLLLSFLIFPPWQPEVI